MWGIVKKKVVTRGAGLWSRPEWTEEYLVGIRLWSGQKEAKITGELGKHCIGGGGAGKVWPVGGGARGS